MPSRSLLLIYFNVGFSEVVPTAGVERGGVEDEINVPIALSAFRDKKGRGGEGRGSLYPTSLTLSTTRMISALRWAAK